MASLPNAVLKCMTVLAAGIAFFSCNNTGSVAFPDKELGYAQPVATPLQFTTEKKLVFDTPTKGGVHPVIKKMDFAKLPSSLFDSTGFKPFPVAPVTSSFNFDALPDTVFNPGKLVSASLRLKMVAINPPAATRIGMPAAQKGHPLSIFDLGPKLGLPAVFITSLLKDRNGLLWIGSAEGLFRYDGENLQAILPAAGGLSQAGMAEDNTGRIWFIDQRKFGVIDLHKGQVGYSTLKSVNNNNLSKIIRDRAGRIWISKTKSQEVLIIDPATETFKSLNHSNGLPGNNGANDITEDSTGKIWITTLMAGTAIVNWEAGKIKYLRFSHGLANDSLRAATTDKWGNIWIAISGGGADEVDTKKGTITHFTVLQGLKAAFTGDISSDNAGRIWIGKSKGLDILNPGNSSNRFLDDSRGLSSSWVSSCTPDNDNRMWVSTIGGLHMIDQHGETVHPLGTANIISLMEDTVGNLWVATQKGLKIVDTQKKIILTLDKAHGLSNDFVQSFVRVNREMWVTSDGGLDIIDPISKTIEHTGKAEGLTNDTVYVVYKDMEGNTWFTGPSNGVDLIDSSKNYILHTDVAGGLSDDNIQDVKEDRDGLVWLAGNTGGINVIDLRKRTVKYLNNQPGLRDTCNRMLLKDAYGRLWIGTDKGIYMVDKARNEITAITTREGLSHNRVTSLLEYKGSIIAGTNNKVSIITAPLPGSTDSASRQWSVAIAGKSDGLLREVTNSWATDAITAKGQYLWGDNGIAILNEIKPATAAAATFITGVNIMTRPNYFINDKQLKDHDTLWAADTFFVKGKLPEIPGYVTRRKMAWDSVSGAYNLPAGLQVPYDQNYIQFHFAQAHLGRQDGALYTYVLEGIDKNWSTVSSNTSTENYLNLPHGNYTFKVSSKGSNGQWSEPASLSFTILPPWWQTWWAYTLMALLGIGVLRAYIVYRSRQLQRENKVLEEKVQLRTKQLQQSLEDLKATQTQLVQSEKMASLGELTAGIAHEIQNPLNFINNFSEVNKELLVEMKEEIEMGNSHAVKAIANDIIRNEEKINHHGQRADAIVKSMLQHSRSNNNSVKEPVNINKLADEYLRLAYHGLRAKDKSFNATLQTDYDESLSAGSAGGVYVIPQDMGRVILNLITNAFYAVTDKKKNLADKVAGDRYEPMVSVTTKKTGNKVEIKVKDNGNGVPAKVMDKIFQPFFTTKPTGQGTGLGLSLAYDIVKAHGGELKLETKEGEGATFIIQLPVA